MIKSIEFTKDFRCFKAGDKFEFKSGVNVLVGDQGTGKSTVIELLRQKTESKKKIGEDMTFRAQSIKNWEAGHDGAVVQMDLDTKGIAFDFERESLRDMSMFNWGEVDGQLASMQSSHGQSNVISITNILNKIKKDKSTVDSIIFDEPDAAMSPRTCYTLVHILNEIANTWKKQVIVSVHNPIIICGKPALSKELAWTEVLSLEDKRWMPGADFLKLQMIPPEYLNRK